MAGQNLATSQSEFDAAYLAAQPPAVQQLMAMSGGFEKVGQAQTLTKEGYIIDNTIMVWGWSAYYTTQSRQQYGYTWVPSAGMPPLQIAPNISQQGIPNYDAAVIPPGAILVTLDLNLLPSMFPAPK